jgi:hypothetical protein
MGRLMQLIYLELKNPSKKGCYCDLTNINGFIMHGLTCRYRTAWDIKITKFFVKHVKII